MVLHENIRYADIGNQDDSSHSNCLCDLYLPDTVSPDTPLFIHFHGGGLVNGTKTAAAHICKTIAARGIAAVSANYRLYPDTHYPGFIEDAASCAAYWHRELPRFTGGRGRIFIGGESAGAYLSMMLCFDRSYLMKHGMDPDKDISGWLHGSGQPTTHFNVLRERGLDSRLIRIDGAAPLYFADRNTFAPMILLTSTEDMPGRMAQLTVLEAALRQLGCEHVELHVNEGRHCSFCSKGSDGKILYVEHAARLILGESPNAQSTDCPLCTV